MFEETRDLFTEYEPKALTKFVLTGKRNLIRILDIGLIVPELVACNSDNNIQFFSEENLGEIGSIDSAPPAPVLLEIKDSIKSSNYILGVESVAAIHFSDEEEKENYLARPFENVPNNLFKFKVTPSLFDLEKKDSSATFNKLDKKLLAKNYREADAFSALLWQCIAQGTSAKQLIKLLTYIANQKREFFSGISTVELIEQAVDIKIEAEVASILCSYFAIISSMELEYGWVANDVLKLLKSRFDQSGTKSDLFEKWFSITESILNNEKELITLTDERQIALRAVLLHLLNPDLESINRIALREPAPGEKIISVARILAAVREGFSAMDAKRKEATPGAYFLVSSLIANAMSDSEYDLSLLNIIKSGDDSATLEWNNALVGEYALLSDPTEENSAENLNVDSSNESKGSESDGITIHDLAAILETIDFVDKVTESENSLIIELNKRKIKPVTLPKHSEFSMQKEGDDWFVMTRLLDFSVASHIKKLTSAKTRSALIYQTDQSRNFYFDFLAEDRFQASIKALDSEINKVGLTNIIHRLIDAHIWMKS